GVTETRAFARHAVIPYVHEALRALGFAAPTSPLNFTFFLALAAAVGVWALVYRSRLGYAIRTVGANPSAAVYAGLSPARLIMVAMTLSGALAGGLAVNEIMGVQHRLLLEFTSGYGFVGIAVALMGRAHPAGIIFAALLFGVLYQGGAELAFDMPAITRDMVVVIGGVIVLFAGALEGLFRRLAARLVALGAGLAAGRRVGTAGGGGAMGLAPLLAVLASAGPRSVPALGGRLPRPLAARSGGGGRRRWGASLV